MPHYVSPVTASFRSTSMCFAVRMQRKARHRDDVAGQAIDEFGTCFEPDCIDRQFEPVRPTKSCGIVREWTPLKAAFTPVPARRCGATTST